MWHKLKKWWKGYIHLRVYLVGGQIIDLYVSDWRAETLVGGRIASYSFVFHPQNRNNVQTIAIEDISALVVITG